MVLKYISEEKAIKLIKKMCSLEKSRIKKYDSFLQHLIDTGNIAFKLANKIIEKYPNLGINPEIVKVAGYMHDFSKIFEQPRYHEIGTAYIILTKGEEYGLVFGGTKEERKEALKEVARTILTDFSLYEELGGEKFPDVFYKEDFKKFSERWDYLRKELGDGKKLSIEELTLPNNLNQKILSYADLTNRDGKIVSTEWRFKDILRRYKTQDSKMYKVTTIAKMRVLDNCGKIEKLIK